MSTIKDVAAKVGCSVTTVSHALSGKRHVAEETRKRIMDAIAELNYYPNQVSLSLLSSRTRIIGLVYPLPELVSYNQCATELIFSLGNKLYSEGYNTLLSTIPYDDTDALRELALSGYLDGLILMDIRLEDKRVQMLRELNFPFICVGRQGNTERLDFVDGAVEIAAYEAVLHLGELGHCDIAYLGRGSWDLGFNHWAHQGYMRGIKDLGLSYDSRLATLDLDEDPYPRLPVDSSSGKLPFSAIICSGSMSAIRVLMHLEELGLSVPDDVSIMAITLGASGLLKTLSPTLSSFDICVTTMADKVVDILLQRINESKANQQHVLLQPRFIQGDTTASFKKPDVIG